MIPARSLLICAYCTGGIIEGGKGTLLIMNAIPQVNTWLHAFHEAQKKSTHVICARNVDVAMCIHRHSVGVSMVYMRQTYTFG